MGAEMEEQLFCNFKFKLPLSGYDFFMICLSLYRVEV